MIGSIRMLFGTLAADFVVTVCTGQNRGKGPIFNQTIKTAMAG